MTQKTFLAIAAQLKASPNKKYAQVSFFKDRQPRDFTGAVLLQEVVSLKDQIDEQTALNFLKTIQGENVASTITAATQNDSTEENQALKSANNKGSKNKSKNPEAEASAEEEDKN